MSAWGILQSISNLGAGFTASQYLDNIEGGAGIFAMDIQTEHIEDNVCLESTDSLVCAESEETGYIVEIIDE